MVTKAMGLIAHQVLVERERQDEKWGEQNHPNGTGDAYYIGRAQNAKEVCDEVTAVGALTWDLILLEEVYEALAESDPVALRAELVQVAAVAQAWIEKIDRDTVKEQIG